ncbi:Putative tranposase (fragment) [Bradyrhizobium sp. ORS 285]
MWRPGKPSIPSCRDESTACANPTRPPDGLIRRAAGGSGPPVGLRPPLVPLPPALSHPDCRWVLTLIVAAQVTDICRKAGISPATYFSWKKKYDGLLPTEMRRLKQLEDENGKLRKLVADLSLDKEMLQDMIRRKL